MVNTKISGIYVCKEQNLLHEKLSYEFFPNISATQHVLYSGLQNTNKEIRRKT